MPLYNVDVTLDFTMVVQANDETKALATAYGEWRDAMDDGDEVPTLIFAGEIASEKHLRDGWDAMCLPYGGDGITNLRDLLTPNVELRGRA